MRDYGNIFSGGCWYSTMDVTLVGFFHFHMYLTKKSFVKFYYADIFDGRYIGKVDEMISIFSIIIIVGTGCFP